MDIKTALAIAKANRVLLRTIASPIEIEMLNEAGDTIHKDIKRIRAERERMKRIKYLKW